MFDKKCIAFCVEKYQVSKNEQKIAEKRKIKVEDIDRKP